MWGGVWAPASSRAGAIGTRRGGMHAAKGLVEILKQPVERQVERAAPPDQYIIVSRPHSGRRRKPDNFAQPPANAVALDRIADLLGNSKSDTHRSILTPIERLQHKSADGRPGASRDSQKISALPEPLHRRRGRPRRFQALSRLRPRARRAAMTLRPPVVLRRARNP